MSLIELFHSKHVLDECYRAWSPSISARLSDRFPIEVLSIIESDGLGSYDNQLFWTVDPDDLGDVVRYWLPAEKTVIPLFYTSFGQLFLWNGTSVYFASVHLGYIAPIAFSARLLIEIVFNNSKFIKRVLDPKLHKKAASKAGRLRPMEVYLWKPLLSMGGDPATSEIIIAPITEALTIVAQAAPITMVGQNKIRQ